MSIAEPANLNRPLVIFDLDGTLVDSLPGIIHCLVETLANRGLHPSTAELRTSVGAPLLDIFGSYGFDDIDCAKCIDEYRVLYKEHGTAMSAIFPGIVSLLDDLKETGHALAIATSKIENVAHEMLSEHGLIDYFESVVGSTEDGTRLHKIDLINEALLRTSYQPNQAVMIGDRDWDINGANAAGVFSIGATWGYASDSELFDAGAQSLAETPESIISILQKI